ncbi:tripartite tricarboxylate transporter TctB family protein [Fodinicurvata sediminis]|uniref:tripartite tricarboxylate transporter TctB family protein n=1 Tax=Fodinicurvata sediminis TaxID=1121832 RepID=UPI0003B3A282|nr:tripartite tricarboxylate transporter TctB family protein [Fodinicurvata sediminis]
MTDRIVGLVILASAIWYGVTAGTYEASFGDPLGPAAFPVMLSVPVAVLSLFLLIRPDANPDWARGAALLRQVAAICILVSYALLLERLGFLFVTFLAVALLGRLLGSQWGKSAVSGAVISLVLFVAFDQVLGLPLPALPEFMS